MNHRITRINILLLELLSALLKKELSLKKGIILTLTRVDTSRDLRYTRVFVSVFPETETVYALKTLGREKHDLQVKLHRKLSMRPLPRIDFFLDTTERGADEIEKILKEIAKEKEK
jgi:ribosome-binding factor A